MSLRVWLPLIKDLGNQGLDKVTVTNNGATFNSVGKLGGCYSFSGSSQKIVNTLSPIITSSVGSLSCWIKMNSLPGSSSFYNLMQLGNLGGYATCRLGLYMEYTNKINISIDGSSTGANVYTHSLVANQWYHICATYNGTIVKLYIDGNEVLSKTASKGSYTTAASYLYVGGTSSYYLNGYMNDARYYDHALSPLEVKQISQGLILHYPLNNNGWGQGNLLINSSTERTSKNSYPFWPFAENDIPKISGNVCTISFDAKSTVDNVACDVYFRNTTSIVGQSIVVSNITTKYKRYSVTMTAPTSTFVSICIRNNHNVPGASTTATYSYKNIKVELGQKATPWCPHEADELYNKLEINNNIQYDTSGYKNNGIKTGTFAYDSDTPKYNVSMIFDKASYINIGQPLFYAKDEVTVNIWVKADSWVTNPGIFFSCIESGGYGWQKSGNNYKVLCGTGTQSNTYITNNIVTTSLDASKWHMMTLTYDGFVFKTYVDAVLTVTTQQYDTKTPLYFNSKTTMFIGAEAIGNKTTPAASDSYPKFKGKLSDVRVYCTALSAEDIVSLYNNSAYIDNQGNIYGAIYEEV